MYTLPRLTLQPYLEVRLVKISRFGETYPPLSEVEKPKAQARVAPELLRVDGFVGEQLPGLATSHDENRFSPRLRASLEAEGGKRVDLIEMRRDLTGAQEVSEGASRECG